MLDLSKNDPAKVAEAGYEFNVVLPDGTETDGVVKVRGVNSKKVQTFSRALAQELTLKSEARVRRGKKEEMSIEEAEELACRVAANRIISWKNIGDKGVEVVFSEAVAEEILKEYPYLRVQVMEESDNLMNFPHG
jgi:hypothetical protein